MLRAHTWGQGAHDAHINSLASFLCADQNTVFVLCGCHHCSPLGHCRTMKSLNRTTAWGHTGWNTEQFHAFHLLFSGLVQGLHLSRCPRCWKKALQAEFNENVHISLDQWSFSCCLETYTGSFFQNLTIRTSDNAASRLYSTCSLACTPCTRCYSIVFEFDGYQRDQFHCRVHLASVKLCWQLQSRDSSWKIYVITMIALYCRSGNEPSKAGSLLSELLS